MITGANRCSLLRKSCSVHSSKMYSQSFNMHLSSTGNFLSVYMIATYSFHSLCSYTPECLKQIFVMHILIIINSNYSQIFVNKKFKIVALFCTKLNKIIMLDCTVSSIFTLKKSLNLFYALI